MKKLLAVIVVLSLLVIPKSVLSVYAGIPTDVVNLRTEVSSTVQLGFNLYGTSIYEEPIHYKDDYDNPLEQWKDIDLTWQGNQITKAPYILTIDDKNQVTIRDKKTNDIVTIKLISGDSKFDIQSVLEPDSRGYKLQLPHGSDVQITKNKKVTRYSIYEQSDEDKLLSEDKQKGFIDVDDKTKSSYSIKINSDLSVFSSASDADLNVEDATYNTAWTATTGYRQATAAIMRIGQRYTGGLYTIYKSEVYFDTHTIPSDATIISATLNLYGNTDASTNAEFLITIQNGQPTYPHDPVVEADYDKSLCSGDGGSFDTTGGFVTNNYNVITLNSTGRGWIQKGGSAVTKFYLRSSREIAGTTSSVAERVIAYTSEQTNTDKDPFFYVVYSTTTVPSVDTNAADDITYTTVTLNGEITDDGSATIDYYGFVWGLSDEGDPGDVDPSTPAGTWDYGWKSASGDYGENPFDHAVTGLPDDTTIYFRAAAHNSEGWVYGDTLNFPTDAYASLTVTNSAADNITDVGADLHGEVTDNGGINPTVVGFKWDDDAPGAPYTNDWNAVYSADVFSHTISGMPSDTTVYWIAYAINLGGTGESAELNFDTLLPLPLPPTAITITQTGTNAVTIDWTTGLNATTTIIRGKEDSQPTSLTDGFEIYNGALETVDLTGLGLGMSTYYYSFWSNNATGNSLTYVTANIGGSSMILIALILMAMGIMGAGLGFKKSWLLWLSIPFWFMLSLYMAYYQSWFPASAQHSLIFIGIGASLAIGFAAIRMQAKPAKQPVGDDTLDDDDGILEYQKDVSDYQRWSSMYHTPRRRRK